MRRTIYEVVRYCPFNKTEICKDWNDNIMFAASSSEKFLSVEKPTINSFRKRWFAFIEND